MRPPRPFCKLPFTCLPDALMRTPHLVAPKSSPPSSPSYHLLLPCWAGHATCFIPLNFPWGGHLSLLTNLKLWKERPHSQDQIDWSGDTKAGLPDTVLSLWGRDPRVSSQCRKAASLLPSHALPANHVGSTQGPQTLTGEPASHEGQQVSEIWGSCRAIPPEGQEAGLSLTLSGLVHMDMRARVCVCVSGRGAVYTCTSVCEHT